MEFQDEWLGNSGRGSKAENLKKHIFAIHTTWMSRFSCYLPTADRAIQPDFDASVGHESRRVPGRVYAVVRWHSLGLHSSAFISHLQSGLVQPIHKLQIPLNVEFGELERHARFALTHAHEQRQFHAQLSPLPSSRQISARAPGARPMTCTAAGSLFPKSPHS